jgi:hypothetical protein
MKVSAHVRLTLEVAINQTWTEGTSLATMRQEASDAATQQLRSLFADTLLHATARMIGDPKVTIVLAEDV